MGPAKELLGGSCCVALFSSLSAAELYQSATFPLIRSEVFLMNCTGVKFCMALHHYRIYIPSGIKYWQQQERRSTAFRV